MSTFPGDVSRPFEVQLPDLSGAPQDGEYCLVKMGGVTHQLRLHDYGSIFKIPGLYERLFGDLLRCRSPHTVVSLLADTIRATGDSVPVQRVLDVGAGNGAVGSELRSAGFQQIWGLDRSGSARAAARRDHPDLYKDYLVVDVSSLREAASTITEEIAPTCVICVGAIGFDDAPVSALADFIDLLPAGGWFTAALHEDLTDDALNVLDTRHLTLRRRERYQHRLAIDGRPIHYVCLVGSMPGKPAAREPRGR